MLSAAMHRRYAVGKQSKVNLRFAQVDKPGLFFTRSMQSLRCGQMTLPVDIFVRLEGKA
jgi:hypothetical protein